ncbi:diguanylate cyclase [Aquabacter sp. L1I39]|uniref:GGDEF domain-containing protein n=1 Tax=Aquabacter sp. L1I39 TaxID=2820278 RepID=UPI001ADC4B61|nr:GGDEF domain-containing protein [Aquabacter sp. L1I39]QTL02534.1 diguanylate cyclase [Aquabacter sp. L1I39]
MNKSAVPSRAELCQTLAHLANDSADDIVSRFYARFLDEFQAQVFLSSEMVEERLKHSLRHWIVTLFSEPELDEAAQRQIGEVHARIRIPPSLVVQGANLIKIELLARLETLPMALPHLVALIRVMNARVDAAVAIMTDAYMARSVQRAQMDEAYRLFELGQDITLEHERQRAELMEWSQGLLFSLLEPGMRAPLRRISASPFGLWVVHRAGLLFDGRKGLDDLVAGLRKIDLQMLTRIEAAKALGGPDLQPLVTQLQRTVEELKFLLNEMFQSIAAVESGRDPLTRALNRRFMPTILSREISIAAKSGRPFSVLMLDVDCFKAINDRHGHGVGDVVLRHVAEHVLYCVRASDFVFRYGGEEFLIALVETGAEEALAAAERIRTTLEGAPLRLPDQSETRVTVSIGIAVYGGHPDYALLVDGADRALYAAKTAGRNRSVLAA